MTDEHEHEHDRPGFRRPGFIVAAAVVAVILLGGGFLAGGALLGGSTPGSTAAASRPPASGSRAVLPVGAASTCGLAGYAATGTVDQAPDVAWKTVGVVAVPVDPHGAGPGRTDADGFQSCYAHTPAGALFAATNLAAIACDGTLLKDAVNRLWVPGAGQRATVAQLPRLQAAAGALRWQVAGFRVNSYSADQAVVELALTVSNGNLVALPYTLAWSDGDWKVVVNDDGSNPIQATALQNLGGYTPWSGS